MYNFFSAEDPLELRQLTDSVRKFAEPTLRGPSPAYRREDFNRMAALGLTALSTEKTFGAVGTAAAIFEIARTQLGPAVYLSVHLLVLRLLATWDQARDHQQTIEDLVTGKTLAAFCLTEAQAGSDASAQRTTATAQGDNYILNGEKIYITSGGIADVYLVFARTAPEQTKGISAFVVKNGTPGMSFGKPEKKMGCEGSPITTITFENCVVSASSRLANLGDGYRIALSGLSYGRVNIGAMACGLASRSLEIATHHMKERKQFGKELAKFQGLQFMLADMAMKLKASLLLTREAAATLDRGNTESPLSAMAKCFATDSAMQITTDGVQLLGGAGYLADYEVERLMRDAKMLQIVEGTNQIQRILIARSLLGTAME